VRCYAQASSHLEALSAGDTCKLTSAFPLNATSSSSRASRASLTWPPCRAGVQWRQGQTQLETYTTGSSTIPAAVQANRVWAVICTAKHSCTSLIRHPRLALGGLYSFVKVHPRLRYLNRLDYRSGAGMRHVLLSPDTAAMLSRSVHTLLELGHHAAPPRSCSQKKPGHAKQF
jgi:hypothetical protein